MKNNWLFLEAPTTQEFRVPTGGDIKEATVVHGPEELQGKTVLYWIEPKKYKNYMAIQEKDVVAVL